VPKVDLALNQIGAKMAEWRAFRLTAASVEEPLLDLFWCLAGDGDHFAVGRFSSDDRNMTARNVQLFGPELFQGLVGFAIDRRGFDVHAQLAASYLANFRATGPRLKSNG
jgi:hypothetical protein